MDEDRTADAYTNTDPLKNISIINTGQIKKKPHNVTIKNYNPNEPKVYPNMKYTEKQKYRRYKTKTEPKLYSKIMIDEEDDIITTIKKAFGIENKNKQNFSNVETSGADYVKDPELTGVDQTKPPNYITQLAKDNADYNDLDEFEREMLSFFDDDEKGTDREKIGFIPDETPPHTPPGSTKGFSISTEITGAVASPSPMIPNERIAKLDAELQAFIKKSETEKTEALAKAEAAKAKIKTKEENEKVADDFYAINKKSLSDNVRIEKLKLDLRLAIDEENAKKTKAKMEEYERETPAREAAYKKKQKEDSEEMALSTFKMKKRDFEDYPPTHIKSRKEFIVEAGELTLANLNIPDTDKKSYIKYKKSNLDTESYIRKNEWNMYQKAYMDRDFKRPLKDKDVWDAYKTYLRS